MVQLGQEVTLVHYGLDWFFGYYAGFLHLFHCKWLRIFLSLNPPNLIYY